jgi:hypothetical protein
MISDIHAAICHTAFLSPKMTVYLLQSLKIVCCPLLSRRICFCPPQAIVFVFWIHFIDIFCRNNPIIHVKIEDGSDDNALFIDLRAPAQVSIGFEVKLVSAYRKHTFESKSTGVFRYGCTVLELESLPAGTYAVQVMTFNAGQECPFICAIQCSTDFTYKRVQ